MKLFNAYHKYELAAHTLKFIKLMRVQFEEGSYLLVFRNRDTQPKRIRFSSYIQFIETKQLVAGGKTPLETMVEQSDQLVVELRNAMLQHTEDLTETASHARMHRDSFDRQLTYTILETALVVLANGIQLYYIRRLFESKHVV